MIDSTPLSDLFQRWRQLRDQGQPTPPEQLCPDRPELVRPLREKIDAFLSLQPSDAPTDIVTRPDTPPPLGIGDPVVPRLLDGYLIERVLGHGGMGVVYQARHPHMDLTVALKTMRGGVKSPQLAERFLRERRAVALLTHPNIVRLFDAGLADGNPYFTMALVSGGSLKDLRKSLVGDPRRAVALMEKVARGVQHAHEHGIIHRDLKPGNILLDPHGEPQVSDFGLAKFVNSSEELTMSGTMPGTLPYMAPEQLTGPHRHAGPASDLWALGVILYELLTGRRPFAAEDSILLMQEITSAEPPRPRTLNPALDAALETVVLKCLEKSPARRYASVGALADDLARWLRGEPIGARPEPWARRLLRRVKRRPLLYAATLAAVVVVTMLATLWWTAGDPPNKPEQPPPDDPATVLRGLQADLERGRKVQLIGAIGPPCWYRSSQGTAFPTTAKDGTWQLDARGVALLELMPDPRCDHYGLEAEMCQDDYAEHGVVGLYVGGEERPAQSGEYYFFDVSFADKGELKGRAQVQLYNLSPKHAGPFDTPPWQWTFQVPPIDVKTWRRVVVEMHPTKIVGRIDDTERQVTREELHAGLPFFAMGRQPLPDPPPTFGPRQACGVFVRGASVHIRNVSITPLQP
jgi:serine/threonine-protein kinase